MWARFGNVPNYVEPFFGSGAVLLARPTEPKIETINDRDCYLSNFWRALQHDPEAVAHYADWPINQADLNSRHRWLTNQAEFRENMLTDPDYYDTKVAGLWVWGASCWIGQAWCRIPNHSKNKLPSLGNQGVHRVSLRTIPNQISHLSDAGQGINRSSLRGENKLLNYLTQLADRLRYVRVTCGDWTQVVGPSVTTKNGITGIFLDPPYSAEANRDTDIYSCDDLTVAHDVRNWALAHGDDPKMRIALCGYEGEHLMPETWECVPWKSHGGYSVKGKGRGRENSKKERLWFSPYCLKPDSPAGENAEVLEPLLPSPLHEKMEVEQELVCV